MSNLNLGFDLDALMNKGKPRFEKKKYESLKQGTAYYRILPSFSDTNKRLDHKYHVHWLKFTNDKGELVNVKAQCVKFIEGFCPLCEAHKGADEALKHAKANGITGEALKRLEDTESALRASGTVYYNAVNANNEVVILQLSSTVSGLLDKKIIEAVQEMQIDPTNPSTGIWFMFSKQGFGRDSVVVDFKQIRQNVNGKIMSEMDTTPIPEELSNRLGTLVTDIHNPDNLGIRLYSGKELADFLRGTPLPDRRPNRQQEAVTEQSAPVAQQAPVQETIVEAIARTDSQGTRLDQAIKNDGVGSAPVAAPVSAGSNAAAEIARLRAMSQKK